jgi:hypothetical protein
MELSYDRDLFTRYADQAATMVGLLEDAVTEMHDRAARFARAALINLHSTSDRQRTIADAVGTAAKAALRNGQIPKDGGAPSGTKAARRHGKASRNASTEREN